MKIETRYDIGQHIWIVYEDRQQVSLYDDIITEIAFDDNQTLYYGKQCDNFSANDIVPYEDKTMLINKIEKLMEEIHKKEEKDK